MANKKIQATATLFLDTKDAQSDAKKFVNDLKQKLSEVETAADKMTVFKDMVAYIAQVDRALAALRKNNKEAFNSMFDGLDINLKQQLEGLFGVNGAQLGQVDALREKLNTLTLKSNIKEIRTFAKEINTLFTSIGVSAPFDNINEQFSGRTNTGHIQALATSLANFATVWEDLSARVSQGFGGAGGSGSGVFGGLNNEVQEEIDKLKKQKEDITSIVNQIKEVSKMSSAWEDGDAINLDFEATEEAAQKLIDRFKQLDDAINNNEFDDKSVAYADALTERAKIALQLIELNNRLIKTDVDGGVSKNSPSFLRNFLADNEDGDNIVNYAIEDFVNETEDLLENLQEESANTIRQINELKKSINDTFSTDGGKSSGSNTFESIGDAAEDAGDKVDTFSKKVDNLNESIKRVYMSALDLEVDTRSGNASGKEFMNLFGADGIVSTTQGVDYQVDTDTLVQQLVANLNRDIVMSLHNHANGDMSFSPSDINSFAKMYYGQGTKINGIIANGFIHTIDFNSIGQEVAIQIAQDYQDGIQHLFEAKNIAQFASFENGSIVPSDLLKQAQASNPEYYQEVIDQLQEAQMTVLRQAFEKNGAEFTLQSFGLDNIDELSTYLANVQKNTQNAIEPVEKLKNLISTLRPSADLSEFTEVFDKFKNGAIDGSQALNQVLNLTPNNISDKTIDETNQKLREQEQLWENVKIAIKNGIGEAVGIDDTASTLEVIEREIKEGILTSFEECIARFREFNNISEEGSLEFVRKRERVIEDRYDTYLSGYDEVVSKEEADKLRQLSIQQEQLYQNLRSAIKGTLSDIVDVDDMTYAFDTLEKEIEAGLLTTLDQCIERFKLLTGLDDKRLTSIKDDQRVADSWDYYQGNRYVSDNETVIDSSEYNQLREDLADERDRANQYAGDAAVAEDRADKAEARAAEAEARVDELREQLSTQTNADHKSQLAQAEVAQLELLQQKLLEVKTAVDAKTQAFEEEYVTVDAAVDAEIASLNKLKDVLTEIQEILQVVLSVSKINIGDVELTQGKENVNVVSSAIQTIEQTLGQILAVLQGFTGLEAEGKNSIKHKESTANIPANNANATEHLVNKLNDLATEGTLAQIPAAIKNLSDAILSKNSSEIKQTVGNTENPHYVTDPQGNLVYAYRGIHNSYSGLVSNRYHGGTFSTDNIELAKEYAGELGKVEKVLLSMKNPMEIDGHGALWNQIEYIGDNSDKASQRLYELRSEISATKQLLSEAEKIQVTDKEMKNIRRGLMTESDTKREREISYWTKELEKLEVEKASILSDKSNPYGKKNTNELVEIAKNKGYDGVIFKNIIDSATGDVKDLSTVMVTFEQDQIHYLETISSTFDSAVDSLKNHYGDLIQHVSASSDEVEASIRKMVELRGKVDTGEISQDEYDKFVAGNAIARDFDALADQTMNTPNWIDGALNGEEFYLNSLINDINMFINGMRDRLQKVAQTFGKESIPLGDLLNYQDVVNTDTEVETSNEVGSEVQQLNNLQAALVQVKNAVMAKTKAFIDEGTTVGQVVGKEVSALTKLSEIVDGIAPKVNTLAQNLKNIDTSKLGVISQETSINTDTGVQDAPATDPFKTKLSAQKGTFTKYRKDVQDADYLTEDLKKQIDSLAVSLGEVSDQPGLDVWIKRFVNLKENVQAAKSEFEQMNLGTVNLFQRELTNSFNKLSLPQREEMLQEYLQAIVLLDKQKQAVKEGHAVEIAAIKDITAELQKKINAQIEANKVAKDAETAQKKNSKFGDTASRNATAKYNSLIGSANSDQFTNSQEVAAIVGEYEKAYKAMIAFRNELRNSDGVVSEADEAEFKILTTECNEYAKALDKLIKSTMKLKGNKANPNDYMLGSDFVDDAQGRKQALTDFVKSVYDIDVAAENFKKDWNEVVFAVDNGDGTFTQMTATFTAARNEIIALAGDTNKVQGKFESFIDGVKNRLQSLSQYFIATVGIYDVWNVIKQGINYVREIDSALTELKKVTDATETSYNNFLQTASKTAATLGSTVSDFVDATADFARLGYDLNQASQLAEAASVYKNVGDGIDDVAMASESIISTMKAFGIEANNAMGIVDRFNEVGNNFAISSTGIGEAMQRSASALYESGNTIDESIALITAANSVIQNPEQVGTALKTLALRLRGAKVELEEAGEDVEGMAESTSQLQAKLLALTHGKVDIMLDEDTFKNTTQILREMAGAWEEMTDIERSAALELMGGKRQANILASVIKNFDTVEDVIATSMNSSGSAIAENEKYLDSIQGKIDLFNNSLQTMWMNFIDSKTVKNIVSLGTALIKLVDTIGLIPTGVGLFAGWKFAAAELEKAFGKTNISTKELKKNINDYINQQKAAGQTATATAQEVVIAEQQKTAAQTQATAVGAAEEAQDKKNIATDLAGAAADKVKAESQKEENQTQIDGVVAGKAEENQDKKNIAIDLAGAGADVGAGANAKNIIKADTGTVSVLGKIGTGIKAVGIALGKAALVMLAVKAATWAIGKAWEALDKNVIHRAEHIKEEVKSLQDSYESMKETLDSNLNTLNTSSDVSVYKTLEDEFAELAKGVDRYGNNISLTTDQYERYKAICQQIVGIQPSIAAGYDSATKAIGNNVNILEDLIELQRIQARQNAEERVSDENFGKFAEDALNDYNEALRNYRVAKSTAFSDLNAILYQSFKSTKQIYAETLGSFDFSGNGTEDDDFMEYVLSTLGVENIPQVIQSYFRAGQYDVTGFLNDYYNQIKENSLNFGIDYQSALNDTFTDIAKTIRTGGNDIKKANDALVDDFLIVPQSEESYDELGDASKNFITDWIKNSSQFKVDANQTEKIALENRDKIIDMVNMIAGEDFLAEIDGETISGQDLLDQIYNFDLTSVNWQEYKVKAESFVKAMWDAIGGAENDFGMTQIDLMNMFGFNFTEIESGWQTIAKQIDEHTDMTFEDVREMLGNEMNAKQVDAFFKINWNDVDWNNVQSKQDILDIINKKTQEIGDVTSVKTYSVLVSEVESYNDILSQTSEIVSDNTEVTQEYKDSLTALGLSEEELAECFDDTNELIVKNSDRLHQLVGDKKKAKKATVAEAKAYAQLNYLKIAKQLQAVNGQFINNIKAKGLDITATSMFTAATLENVDSLRDQLEELDNTIQQFALLEIQLSETGEAYQKYQDAKERDAQLSYDETWLEALKTIDNGILSGAVGTEEFEYAVKLIVPEDVYKTKQELGDIDGMIRSIHDYLDGDPLLANWFTVDDESGELSYTIDNARAFIDDLIAAGAAVGTNNDFHFADHINGIDDITTALNEYRKSLGLTYDVTEETVAAMLSGAEDFDATWGNMFSDALLNSTDRSATEVTRAITENQLAMADLVEQYRNGEITLDEYNAKQAELISKHQELSGALSSSRESAAEMCNAFMDINEKIDESKAKLDEYQQLMEKNKDNRNEVGDIIDAETGVNLSDQYAEELEKYAQFLSDKKALEDQYGTQTKFTVGLALESEGFDLENIEVELENVQKEIQDAFETKPVQELNDELESTYGVIAKINDDGDIEYTVTDTTTDDQMETLRRLDAFKADGTVDINALYSGLTPEQKAEVDKLTSLQDKQNLINYYLTMDGTDSAESALDELVRTIKDIHELMQQSPIFACNTTDASSKLGGLLSQVGSWVGTHVADFVARVSTIGSTISGWFNASGNADFSGNSYAAGTAHNRGKIGLPRSEKDSLVGEFGPELVCANGRYYTVGDHGAEFVDLPKDAIIFNHIQTKQLLENGHTNSRGKGRGNLSFASGNAYYGIGSYSPSDESTSFKDGLDVKDWGDITGELSDAADDISDAADDAEQVVDFIEMKLEEIEAIIEKTTGKIANFLDDTTSIKSKDELYDELIKAEKDKSEAYLAAAQKYNVEAAAALSGVPKEYQEMARNGAIAIEEFLGEDQVEIAEKIQEYRDWAAKADEAENGHLEAIAAISAHRVEQLEDIATDFENIVSISKSHSDLLQAEMDFIEESGNRLSESYYEELKKHSQKQLDDMQNERVALQKILDDSVAAGDVIIGSDDWYSMLETIYEVDQEIIDCKTSLEEFQNAINELYWDNFDKLIAEIDAVDSELANLFDLISDNDKIVDDMGNWTADGYTALGLLVQQMEVAQQKSKEYGDAISKLKKDYKDGLYSTDEYNEKLAELTDGQYDAIKSYEDAKDAIISLNKTRVDAVKDGIQKEIDARSELIEKKKEELSADKDARDFERSVEDSNKSISDVERKIASLKGNTSSSAIAERRRLEEELRKLQQEREDLFYDESVENQQEALDKELENFQDAKNKEIEDLEEYLKNQEKVLQDSFAIVQENTQQIAGKLVEIAEDYGVTISDTVATPWIKGVSAIGTYEEQLNTSVSATTKNLEALKQQLKDLETQADKTANSVINATHSSVVETNDGHQTSIKGYATGSKSIEYDQWALIDELGDELQLVPNKAGRLDYIKKGTGILNNTLTERLMDLAMDPTSMLENSKPVVGAPGIITTNNTFTIDASVGTLLHVEHLDGSNPAEVTKLVDKAWEKKMQTLNSSIKKFTR